MRISMGINMDGGREAQKDLNCFLAIAATQQCCHMRACDVCQGYLFSAPPSKHCFKTIFKAPLFPSRPFTERQYKTYKRRGVLRLTDSCKRQKRGMQKPLLD